MNGRFAANSLIIHLYYVYIYTYIYIYMYVRIYIYNPPEKNAVSDTKSGIYSVSRTFWPRFWELLLGGHIYIYTK